MTMKRINPILFVGLIGTLIIGAISMTDVYRAFWGDRSIWWTHQDMRLPIEETKDNFELYIGGQTLRKHLSGGTLFSVDKDGKQYVIVSKDVTVRLNNWDKVKASILTSTTVSSFALGVTMTLLVTGLIQLFHHRKKSA